MDWLDSLMNKWMEGSNLMRYTSTVCILKENNKINRSKK